jgi:hypothetical protein
LHSHISTLLFSVSHRISSERMRWMWWLLSSFMFTAAHTAARTYNICTTNGFNEWVQAVGEHDCPHDAPLWQCESDRFVLQGGLWRCDDVWSLARGGCRPQFMKHADEIQRAETRFNALCLVYEYTEKKKRLFELRGFCRSLYHNATDWLFDEDSTDIGDGGNDDNRQRQRQQQQKEHRFHVTVMACVGLLVALVQFCVPNNNNNEKRRRRIQFRYLSLFFLSFLADDHQRYENTSFFAGCGRGSSTNAFSKEDGKQQQQQKTKNGRRRA